MSKKTVFLSVGTPSEDVLSNFSVDEEGLYYNERLEAEIKKRELYSQSRALNGSKGGRPKKTDGNQKETICFSYGKPYAEAYENHTENENINVNENNNLLYIQEIVEYLNGKLNTRYRYTTKSIQSHIRARLSEGFTVEDFKTVVDKKVKSWLGTEWQKYLRPDTLFGSKFQAYLNEIEKPKSNRDSSFDYDEFFQAAVSSSRRKD